MFARDYVADLAARGRYHFTTDEAVGAIRSPRSAVRAQLRRLRVRGVIAEPIRGFNIIVPAEYRSRGCLPAGALAPFVEKQARSYTPLRRAAPISGAGRDATWKLIVNADMETYE